MNSGVPNYPMTSLYVGDLHPDITVEMLFFKFSTVGTVLSIRICRDLKTQKSLGYAYVNFLWAADAERALDTLNFDLMNNKPIRIMWSQRDPSLRKSGVGNVFIKNLNKAIDNATIYDTFSAFGNILSCKVAQDENGNSKGYGFIHFETEEAANKCIEKVNGMLLNEKRVYVGRFIPRRERNNGLRVEVKPLTNLYVKNFGETLSEDQLRIMFEKYGKITSYKIMSDDDGKSKGFGFVAFESPEDAKTAVEALNGKEIIDGKHLYVGHAQQKAERQQVLKCNFEALKSKMQSRSQDANLYVKNIDDTIDDERLRKEFSQYGTITSAKVMMQDGRSKGFGFVCFSCSEEAKKAVKGMNGRIVGSKPLYVGLAQRKEDRRALLTSRYQNMQPMSRITQIRANPRWPAQASVEPERQEIATSNTEMPNTYGSMTMPPQPAAVSSNISVTEPITGQQPPNNVKRKEYHKALLTSGPMARIAQIRANQGWPVQAPVKPEGEEVATSYNEMPNSYSPTTTPSQSTAVRSNISVRGQQPPNMQSRPLTGQGVVTSAEIRTTNFKHTTNMREPSQSLCIQGASTSIQQDVHIQGKEPLTATMLAAAPPREQKQMLGERLYPIIRHRYPDLAAKITGMLLELDNTELLHILEHSESLQNKVEEAVAVLQAYTAKQAATQLKRG